MKPISAKAHQQFRITGGWFLAILLCIICFGSFVIGYEMVAITMLNKPIRDNNTQHTEREMQYLLSLATAMMPLGAIIGCLTTRRLEALGENRLMIISDIVAIVSSVLMMRSLGVGNLCLSRLLVGISCGVSSSVIPPYLISLSPLEWRGVIGSLHQVFVTVGAGFSIYLGQRLPELTLLGVANWKLYLFLPTLYASVRLFVLLFFKFNNLESHYESGETEKLRKFMRLFYSKVDVNLFVAERRLTKEKKVETPGNYQGLEGKIMSVSLTLLALNQLSGINIVLSYSKQLFMKISYYDEARADFWLQILGVVQVLATLTGGWLANKFGRKHMLINGGYVSTAALFSIFLAHLLSSKSVILLATLIVLFIIAYAGSVGVVSLLYLGELFLSLSSINVVFWSFSLASMLSSGIMLSHFGVGKCFFISGAISFLCVYILSSEIIESQGKTRKELRNEYLYQNKDEGSVHQYSIMKTATGDETNSLIEFDQ